MTTALNGYLEYKAAKEAKPHVTRTGNMTRAEVDKANLRIDKQNAESKVLSMTIFQNLSPN